MTMGHQQQHHHSEDMNVITSQSTTTATSGNESSSSSKTSKEVRQAFPVKVYEMLEDAEEKDFAHIVSWNALGTGFMVHKKDLFINQIVPQYFNQTRYKSFQRQLSLYGFQRVTNGPNKGLRHHEKLRRGRQDLVREMKPVGYKPRGVPKQQHQQGVESSAASSSSRTSQGMQQQAPMAVTAVPHIITGIPTVVSSSSLDKHHFTAGQSNIISPVISEGEESSSEDHHDEERTAFLKRGNFEGMSFYLMSPTGEVLQEFLPTPALPIPAIQPPAETKVDEQLKKAWELGFQSAFFSDANKTGLSTTGASLPAPGPLPPSPRLLLDDCVDALDFHAHAIDVSAAAAAASTAV